MALSHQKIGVETRRRTLHVQIHQITVVCSKCAISIFVGLTKVYIDPRRSAQRNKSMKLNFLGRL
jgi:hypothetical protein